MVIVWFETDYESGSGECRTAVDTFCRKPQGKCVNASLQIAGAFSR
jgi:hypothetical protein